MYLNLDKGGHCDWVKGRTTGVNNMFQAKQQICLLQPNPAGINVFQ